jgi:hypothetical protein
MPRRPSATRVGATSSILLLVLVVLIERGVVGARVGLAASVLVLVAAVGWTLRAPPRLRGLSELYLWLAFILSIYHLDVLANAVAGRIGWEGIEVFRPVAVVQVIAVCVALGALGAWSRDRGPSGGAARRARLAAGLFVVGAVVFWVGARTFPGLALERIQANPEGHLWTSASFMLAAVVTLGGLALFTLVLREAGDRFLSVLGLLVFACGSVFWILHLAVRMTVMVLAAQEWARSGTAPAWYEPWRAWAALLFGLYSGLAYLGLAAYGGALLAIGWRPRWIAWACLVAGVFAALLGGLPLFIHVPLWALGILALSAGPFALRRTPGESSEMEAVT